MDLKLGGEVYEPISPGSFTVAYDLYVQSVLGAAGIHDLIAAQQEVNVSPDAVTRLFMQKLAASGRACDLITAFMQPKDGPWSPAWASETARKFDKLTVDVEKRLLIAILTKGVVDFFRRARRSSKISR